MEKYKTCEVEVNDVDKTPTNVDMSRTRTGGSSIFDRLH